MRLPARRHLSRANTRRGILAGAGIATVAVVVIATAIPAWAHEVLLSAYTPCSDGAHEITWSMGNSETAQPMQIDSATATMGAETFAVTGYATTVAASSWTTGHSTIPAGELGTVTLTVHAIWSDFQGGRSTSIDLVAQCGNNTTTSTASTSTTIGGDTTTTLGGDTTTTIGGDTTTTLGGDTTTTLGGDTTTTLGGDTTTTLGGDTSTSTPSSTTVTSTPVVTEGSVVPSTNPSTSSTRPTGVTAAGNPQSPGSSGSLPFTGSAGGGPIFGLLSLGVGALVLAFANRKVHRRGS